MTRRKTYPLTIEIIAIRSVEPRIYETGQVYEVFLRSYISEEDVGTCDENLTYARGVMGRRMLEFFTSLVGDELDYHYADDWWRSLP